MSADSSHSQFLSRFTEISGVLACPACHGELRLEAERVVCASCGRRYPVVDGIPMLIAEEQP